MDSTTIACGSFYSFWLEKFTGHWPLRPAVKVGALLRTLDGRFNLVGFSGFFADGYICLMSQKRATSRYTPTYRKIT